jgi:Sulfotransferase family
MEQRSAKAQPAPLGRGRPASSGSPNPYAFLVGSARSGTTLLRRIVNAHPLIAISPETHFVPRFHQRRIGQTADGRVTGELVTRLARYRRFERFGVSEAELRELLESEAPLTYAEFVSGFYDLIGKSRGKRLVGDKTGEYARALPALHELWPSARFVHIVRDGRDVALSVLAWKEEPGASRFSTWADDPVMTTALWWEQNVRLAREAGSTLPSRLYHELRYEQLVTNPEEQCASLCAFLELPYEPAMLRFHEGRTRSEPGLSAKKAWLPITPNLRNWREQMAPESTARFEAVAGELLEQLGYERAFPRPQDELRARAAGFRERVAAELRAQRRPVPSAWS